MLIIVFIPLVPEYAYKGSVKYASSVHLTSEEESLADFRHRLESSDKKTKTKPAERMVRLVDQLETCYSYIIL